MITLYKYARIDKHLFDGLCEKTNWVADPKSFNDAFEFASRSEFDLTEFGISRHKPDDIHYKKYNESVARSYGVVSYTELDTNNNLMWAHYADNHKGVCLIFEINPKENPNLYKVKYERHLPKINYERTKEAFLDNLLSIATTKSIDWEYEREWREVHVFKGKPTPYPGRLKGIVFGCRCSPSDMRIIWNIIVPRYNQEVEFSKTYRQEESFQLGSIIHPKESNTLEKFPDHLNSMR